MPNNPLPFQRPDVWARAPPHSPRTSKLTLDEAEALYVSYRSDLASWNLLEIPLERFLEWCSIELVD